MYITFHLGVTLIVLTIFSNLLLPYSAAQTPGSGGAYMQIASTNQAISLGTYANGTILFTTVEISTSSSAIYYPKKKKKRSIGLTDPLVNSTSNEMNITLYLLHTNTDEFNRFNLSCNCNELFD